MTTLAEFMILFGADNRPPLLDKDLYDSWKSIMELYMQNREHGRMILESIEHGLLIWPMIVENGVTRKKKYEELSATEKIQADCDLKATSIILQGLPSDVYSLVNHHRSPQYGSIHPTQHYSTTYPSTPRAITYPSAPYPNAYSSTVHQDAYRSGLAVLMFKQGDDPIDAINKMMSFLSIVVTSRFPTTSNQLRNSSNPRQQATVHDGRVTVQSVQGRQSSFVADPRVAKCPSTQTGITHNATYQADDLDAYDSDCDDISTAKAVLTANLSSYRLDVHSEAPHSENTHNDMLNQKQTTPDALPEGECGFEQTKAIFLKEIIPLIKTLRDIFNVFDKDPLNEDIVNIVVNSSVNMNDSMNYVENCNKCLELEAELIKQHNMVEKDEYNRLLKIFSKLEQH
nr:hypothetical protein [Tanacetum cinerariifolium]